MENANKRKHIRVLKGRLGISTPEITTPLELVTEEKVRVQRILSKKSGSIAAYLQLAKEKAAETEKRFDVKLIRSAPAENISGSEAAT